MNMRRHDLNLLTVLEAILREGSISAAAARLNMTQPAASQALARAREMFSDPLLIRSGRGLKPTLRGLALRDELAAILGQIAHAIDGPVFDPKSARRRFRIATSDLVEMILLPSLLARLREEAPHCQFEILQVQHVYEEGLPDIVLMGAVPANDWKAENLYRDRFVLLARKGHAALEGTLEIERFAAFAQALVSPRGGGFHGPVDDALAASGITRHVSLSLPRFSILPQYLERSDLIAAVPLRFASLPWVEACCGWRELPVEVPPFTVKLVCHPTRDLDPAGQWLRKRATECCVHGHP